MGIPVYSFIVLLMNFLTVISTTTTPFLKTEVSKLKMHNTFKSSNIKTYKTLVPHENMLLIGAANSIFGQSIENISHSFFPRVSWDIRSDEKLSCRSLPSSGNGEKCYSQVQMIQPYNMTHFITCGTNALAPENRFLVIGSGTADLERSNIARSPLCSYDPDDTVTSYSLNEGARSTIYATNRLDQRQNIALVKTLNDNNRMIKSSSGKQNDEATYVGSFSDVDKQSKHGPARKLYFISNEPPRDDSADKTGTTVTQLCASDIGGSLLLKNEWTSLLKLRIICKTDDGLIFDVIKHSFVGADNTLYGVFITKHEQYRVSAVCAFRINDIQKTFNSGQLVDDTPTSRNSATMEFPNDEYTPGMCPYDGMTGVQNATTKDFPMEYLEYMETHFMMSQSVLPAFPPATDDSAKVASRNPLLVKNEETFTHIATQTVTDLAGVKQEVGFVGTNSGMVYKFAAINVDGKPDTIEMAQYKVSDEEIISMEISPQHGYLYLGTASSVHQISTSNCESYVQSSMKSDQCRMCVLARDPFCAWDPNTEVCASVARYTDTTHLKQDVKYGNVDKMCGQLSTMSQLTSSKKVHIGDTVVLGEIVADNVAVEWSRTIGGKEANEIIKATSGKYKITDDKQLIVFDFDVATDMGEYVCKYRLMDTLVAMETITVEVPGFVTPITPSTTTIGSTAHTPTPLPTTTIDNQGDITIAASLDNPTIFSTTNITTPAMVSTASSTTFIVIGNIHDNGYYHNTMCIITGVLFFIILIMIVGMMCYRRCAAKRRHEVKHQHQNRDYDTTDSLQPAHPKMALPVNGSNNSNNTSMSVESQQLLKLEERAVPRFEYYDQNNDNRAKSLDYLGADPDIMYADEVENLTLVNRTHSTMEIPHKRKRTPMRANSQPLSRISVNFGGKKDVSFENCTLTRKKGKWVVELPAEFSPPGVSNTSRTSDAIDPNDTHDGTLLFESTEAPLAGFDPTLDFPPHFQIRQNSTSVLADDTEVKGSSQGSRTGSIRSQKNNSSDAATDSDCTIQASNLTLKPDPTPTVTPKVTPPPVLPKPKKHSYKNRAKDVVIPEISVSPKPAEYENDPTNLLHGQTQPPSATTTSTSPAKSSHSLSSSSSNESRGSSVYKSARSSLNSNDHAHLVTTL